MHSSAPHWFCSFKYVPASGISPNDFALLIRNSLHCIFLLVLLLLARAGFALKPKRQKYAAVPIACVEGPGLAAARERFRKDAANMLREGYEKYKGRPSYVPSPLGERLMIPNEYVEELKTAPVREVDSVGTSYEVQSTRYLSTVIENLRANRYLRANILPWVVDPPCTHVLPSSTLNQHLEETLNPVREEIEDAFNIHLPQYKGKSREVTRCGA